MQPRKQPNFESNHTQGLSDHWKCRNPISYIERKSYYDYGDICKAAQLQG